MPRTPRGPIDMLPGFTILDLQGDTAPEDDFYISGFPSDNPSYGTITVWGVGLISFGLPTAEQQAWMANLANNSDLSTFPGDYVAFNFSTQQLGEIQIVQGRVWVEGVYINALGVTGGSSWSIGGLSSAGGGQFYWSDIAVTEGTSTGETLTGTGIPETLHGLGGDDELLGGGGADELYGDEGNDLIVGGAGFDRLWGGEGDDLLAPGVDFNFGGDPLIGQVDGGDGFDRLLLDYSAGTQSLVLDATRLLSGPSVTGVEAVSVAGTGFADVISGSAGDDQLYGGGSFDVLRGGDGDDWLDAGAPTSSSIGVIPDGGLSKQDATSLDHLFVAGPDGPTVSFIQQTPSTRATGWGLEPAPGFFYSFTVAEAGSIGSIDYDVHVFGGNGTYFFRISDEDGNEVPWFPWIPGEPIVFPDAGTYYLEAYAVNFNSWDYAELAVTLTLESANALSSNILEGGTGNDTYVVYSATDQVVEKPGEGTDLVRSSVSFLLSSNVENLTLVGAGATNGTGNSHANVIAGNEAANVITGAGGADILSGGGGADRFTFTALTDSATGAADRILDFSGKGKGGDGDKIDLSAIDANANTAANDAFHLVNKFNGKPGQIVSDYDRQTGITTLSLDVDGDRSADMIIELVGNPKPTAADFIF